MQRSLEAWLSTPFEGGRHERRISKIKAMEGGR
jgi:ribose 5-phosphate isomerase RpiB